MTRNTEYYKHTHFKETEPENSVMRIMRILNDLGIPLEEKWYNIDSNDVFSVRITIAGTEIGQNGKGVSKEFARASALAEFLERCQNNQLFGNILFSSLNDGFCFTLYPDEKFLSLGDYIAQKDSWLQCFLRVHGIPKSETFQNEIAWLNEIGFNDYIRYGKSGLLCLPYISQRDEKKYYLPYHKLIALNGSNGMCAGNTKEEAIVQGVSEIVERYVQKTLMSVPTSLPDVSEGYLIKYQELIEKIRDFEKQGRYKIFLKDASSLVDYPVAVLVVVNPVDCSYGVRFGAHPRFHIAVERCLTECMQGKTLDEFSRFSEIDFGHTHSCYSNMYNSYKLGICTYPSELLMPCLGAKPYDHEDEPDGDNKELCTWVMNKILAKGMDVLVRDVSYLGFPVYHVVIPGLSDMFPPDLSSLILHTDNTVNYVSIKWHANRLYSVEDTKVLLGLLDTCAHRMGTSSPEYFLLHPCKTGMFKLDKYKKSDRFLAAMCCARIGQWEQCLTRLRELKNLVPSSDKESSRLISLCMMYADAIANGRRREDLNNILAITNINHPSAREIISELDSHDSRIPFLPVLDCENIACKECALRGVCKFPLILEIQAKLRISMTKYKPFAL